MDVSIETLGVLILLVGFFVPVLVVRAGHRASSPLVLIWVSQTMPLGFSLLNFMGEFPDLQSLTWIVLGMSFAAMLFGWAIGTTMSHSISVGTRWHLDPSRLRTGTAILAGMYALSIIQGVLNAGGFPLLAAHPDEARWAFMTGRIQNVFFSAGIPLFILLLHQIRLSGSRIISIFLWLALLGLVVSYLLIGSRFMTLVWLSMTLVYWDQYVRRLPLLRLAVVVALFVGVFVLIGYFRYGRTIAVAHGSTKIAKVGGILAMESVYQYVANAYWNTDYALQKWNAGLLNLPTWGVSTNEGLLWLAGLVPGLQKAYNLSGALNADVTFRSGLNATTYHWGLFKDFGIAGPVFGSFAMGWLLTIVHGKFCRYGAPGGAMAYGLLSYFVIGSFNLLPTVIPTPLIGLFMLVAILGFCSFPKTPGSPTNL
ncbi:MAG TPA: O-antigen polymerase [Fibrobacteria bacterium]|nr:O-antigen polymerase [Fibrobacteria bacterium]